MEPSDPTSVIITVGLKIAAPLVSFIGGVVTATWWLRGLHDDLVAIKKFQEKCPGNKFNPEVNAEINQKLDYIIEKGIPSVHSRIDRILLKEKS